MPSDPIVIVTARNEADRLSATLVALAAAFPRGEVVVADDGSEDGTDQVARDGGATVIRAPRALGKGGAATLAAEHVLERADAEQPQAYVLCDGDLGETASELVALVDAVRSGEADLAVASFQRRVGGGFGVAVRFAGWAIRRLCGLQLEAPISGQRAMTQSALRLVTPFAAGFGMEIGMTVDASRAGLRVREVQLPLTHRATGRTLSGFAHRGRQLIAFTRVYLDRR